PCRKWCIARSPSQWNAKPSQALRQGRGKSSMWMALDAVKRGEADAAVSAGNTGALMAVSKFVLRTLPGIDRPAIATVMPNRNDGYTTVLDLGANVDCSAEHLLQFAVLGSALVSAVDGKDEPSVGLLNIGTEELKGDDRVRNTCVAIAPSDPIPARRRKRRRESRSGV
ncbi:MAG: hypothetical protein HC822_23520, partial [Oscillochloris sp.]|nr:hypothetical protein [Oscillochloris sp.]